jgi:hypothetical protein
MAIDRCSSLSDLTLCGSVFSHASPAFFMFGRTPPLGEKTPLLNPQFLIMTNVTYLFGAGASALRMPVLDGMTDRIDRILFIFQQSSPWVQELPNYWERTNFELKLAGYGDSVQSVVRGISELWKQLEADLFWLCTVSKKSVTIDTFAKKLYLANRTTELKRLKRALCFYFTLEQLTFSGEYHIDNLGRDFVELKGRTKGRAGVWFDDYDSPYDSRYEPFIASLLVDSTKKFRDNVSVFSWNYDIQFEKAYASFLDPLGERGEVKMEDVREGLNIGSKNRRLNIENLNNKFSLLKINGTATFIANFANGKHLYFEPTENLSLYYGKRTLAKILLAVV